MGKEVKTESKFLAALSSFNFGHSAKVVFGEPIRHESFLLVPVAKIRFGFGYGYGSLNRIPAGEGGGGGALVKPIGYIVIDKEKVYFRKIRSWSIVKFAASFALGILLTKSFLSFKN